MLDKWCGDIVGQMHRKRITGKKLAELTGYSEQYISMVLNGHKNSEHARFNIERVLSEFLDDREKLHGATVDELLQPNQKKARYI